MTDIACALEQLTYSRRSYLSNILVEVVILNLILKYGNSFPFSKPRPKFIPFLKDPASERTKYVQKFDWKVFHSSSLFHHNSRTIFKFGRDFQT
jgi:hypothetical protein